MDEDRLTDETVAWPSYVDFLSTYAFVLLLFVGGLLYLLAELGKEPNIRDLQAENNRLKADLQVAEAELTELQKTNDWWMKNYGRNAPRTKQEVNKFLADARRGSPKCQDNNVLAQVSVLNGTEALVVTVPSPELWQFLDSRGVPTPPMGVGIRDSRLSSFLAGVSAFYQSRSRDCRFDYRLTYGTDTDYKRGREKFERYFYAGKPAQATER
jgi:hypothetical protein